MPTVRVAVCLDRLSPALFDCLTALAREVDEPIVAVAGLSGPEVVAVRQLVGRTVPGARVVEAEAGIAQARNAALAAAADADVLALVDDDIAVPRGWRARLEAAWGSTPAEVATLGGPIALRFAGPRPAWLADGLLSALAPLDYGDEAKVVDPAERTFHGGNVSFRTAALRGVGGFWPARGGQRDWLSEEHHAQRELGAAGWSAEYRPELAVERVVRTEGLKRRDLVARRARYGGRLQLIGTRRAAADALRAAATGAAGASVALVRGDSATAAERAARAAENAGALAAPLVAHRDLQPAATSTPFRPSVPEPQRRLPRVPPLRRGREPQGVALLYHRIDDGRDPLGLAVSPKHFAQQIDVLRDRIVPLEQLASGDFPDGAVAITFDDGYADNLPALRGIGVPATVFVSTGHVEEGRTFWWDELPRLVSTATSSPDTPLTVTLDGDTRTWPARDEAQRAVARRALHAWLQPQRPERVEDALAQVRAWAQAPPAEDPRPLTLAELRELAEHVTIGAHGRTHPSLRWLPEDEQLAEMERSRDDLAAWLGEAPRGFSYPFGVPGRDVDDVARRAAWKAGFGLAVVNAAGPIRRSTDPYAIPRLTAPNQSADGFASLINERIVRK